MSPEKVSAIGDVVSAACNVGLVLLAIWGLRSWRNDLRVSSRIDATEKARRLHIAAKRYVKAISAIRERNPTDLEIREGLSLLNEHFEYKTQAPQYYLQLLDTLAPDFRESADEAFLSLRPSVNREVDELDSAGQLFRREFYTFHGTMAVFTPYMIPDSPSVNKVAAMKDITYVSKEGFDQFGDLLRQRHQALVSSLSPHLHLEGEEPG